MQLSIASAPLQHILVAKRGLLHVLVNPQEKRLRAGWRLLIQIAAFFAVVMLTAGVSANIHDRALAPIAGALVYLFGGLAFSAAMARFIDKRKFADFGFHMRREWWVDLGFGLGVGALMLSGVCLALNAAGWITVKNEAATNMGAPIALAFAIKLLLMCAVGINEELSFRGYQLRNLAEGLSGLGARRAILLATLISSTVFGVIHFVNELAGGADTTGIATLNLILSGLMFAIPFLLTGELAIPIGIHIAWNFFEGPVYGFAVSGTQPTTHLFSISEHGPELWTGGAYGPEGGLICTVWMTMGVLLSLLWIRGRRGALDLHTGLAAYAPR